LLAAALVGCAGGERRAALVGCAPGVDCAVVEAAIQNWYTASDGGIHLSRIADVENADVLIAVGEVGTHCAETFWLGGRPKRGDRSTDLRSRIDISPDAFDDPECGDLPTMVAHELGHYLRGTDEHLSDPEALMFPNARDYPVSATRADVDYATR
jgi:hypothetical protein